MRFSTVFAFALFAVFAIQASSAVHLLKPKLIGGALVGKALLGKALLLKKPKLILGGLVAGKLAKKALVVGAGALAAKSLLGHARPCATRTASVARSYERISQEKTIVSHQIEKRSIMDIVNRGIESVSDQVLSAGTRLKTVGDTFNQGVGYVRNASLSATDQIRRGASSLMTATGSIRTKRATMSVDQLLKYVKDRRGEVCLQRIICELSAYNYHYGDEGVRFGTKLLTYENIGLPEAVKYKNAQAIGLQFRVRGPMDGPKACKRKYASCQYDPRAVIADGNQKLN